MIVWSGRGFLIAIVFIASMFASVSIIPKEYADYSFVISFFITGIFSWFFGLKWNKDNERIVIDEKTNKKLRLKNNHTFFWVPMQYWGIISSILGIIILFQNSIIFGTISLFILIGIMGLNLYNNRNKSIMYENITEKEEGKSLKEAITLNEIDLEREKIRKEKEDPSRFMPK